MKNKGFTLIELLAVIVILAIIALIATPIILGIIDDSRKGAAERGAELVISNVELAYSTAYMLNEGNYPTLEQVAGAFKMDGAKMTATGSKKTSTATIKVDDKNVNCTATVAPEGTPLTVKCIANSKEFKPDESSTMILTVEAGE